MEYDTPSLVFLTYACRDGGSPEGIGCSKSSGAGWWYNPAQGCGYTNPNGINSGTSESYAGYISWYFGGERGTTWNSWAATEFLLV